MVQMFIYINSLLIGARSGSVATHPTQSWRREKPLKGATRYLKNKRFPWCLEINYNNKQSESSRKGINRRFKIVFTLWKKIWCWSSVKFSRYWFWRGSEVLSEAVRWRGKAIGEAWIDPPLLSLPWVYVNSILEWLWLVYDEGRLVELVYFLK